MQLTVCSKVPSIQQTAALALGRLANYSEDLAEGIVGNEILPQLVYSLAEQNVSTFFILSVDSKFVFFEALLQEGCCICPPSGSQAFS